MTRFFLTLPTINLKTVFETGERDGFYWERGHLCPRKTCEQFGAFVSRAEMPALPVAPFIFAHIPVEEVAPLALA